MSEERNADQKKFWDGPTGEKWAKYQADMDRNLNDATKGIMRLAVPKPGERVLDIGCGAGQTTFLIADAVGPNGHVTGVDISTPLLDVARARRAVNVDFIKADAAFYPFEPEYNLVFSRFGVMFFDDPVAAFANIRKALKPTGRLAFVCWRPPAENQWVTIPAEAAKPFLPPQPPPDPLAPGPFAFSNLPRVEGILNQAGFKTVRFEKLNGHMGLGQSSDEAAFQMTNLGPLSRALGDPAVDDTAREKVREAVKEAFEAIRTPAGIRPTIACWLISASI